MDAVTVMVGEHLEFDMPRVFEKFLHVHRVVLESRQRLGAGELNGIAQRRFGMHHPHPAPATTAGGLDDDGIANLPGDAMIFVHVIVERLARTGHAGNTCRFHGPDGRDLVTHQPNGFRARTDENETTLFHAFRKIRVLGQKSIARMNGHRIGHCCCTDDGRNIEVGLRRLRRPDTDRFIGQTNMLQVPVYGGMHGNGLDAELAARPEDSQGYLAAIGNDDFVEHACGRQEMMNSGCSNSTGWPLSAIIETMVPARSASMGFMIFMASMMQSGSPSFTT